MKGCYNRVLLLTSSFRANNNSRLREPLINSRRIWSKVPLGPVDPVLGLAEAFKLDKDLKKVNLASGTYRDNEGKPYVLPVVRKAEKLVQAMNLNKEYLPVAGTPEFGKLCAGLVLGDNSEHIKGGLCATTQSVSGTGAVRLAMNFIKLFYPFEQTIYVPNSTRVNHHQIIRLALLSAKTFRYFDDKTNALDFKGMVDDVSKIPEKSIVLLQLCGHNPTGVDPNDEQWNELSKLMKKKSQLVILDVAYHGLASGDVDKDLYAARKFVRDGLDVIICQSFSKNMGLYAERVGALTVLTKSKEDKAKVLSQLQILIRGLYSSPPCNGARIVTKILEDSTLRTEWYLECRNMAERIINMRKALKTQLKKEGSSRNWDHLTNQSGMYSFTGLTPTQVDKMVNEHHIYMRKDGGICFAGLVPKNVEYVGKSMHLVTK